MAKDKNGVIRVSDKTRDRLNALVGLISFWSKHGYTITPGSVDEVIQGLLKIAGAP